jgi:WD40 repeat protein
LAGSALLGLAVFLTTTLAQAPPLPVLDDKPTPQVDGGGPSAAVNAVAFSADGATLYAAGLDKVVRVWTRQQGHFVFKKAYRVPVGPGNAGGINAVALSPDGAWVAIAGRAPMRGEVGFRQGGVIIGSANLSPEQNQDAGVIYVASTANPAGGKVLRGHRGEVRALAFASGRQGKPPLLVSAATEREGNRRFGGLRLWDITAGMSLAERNDLPTTATRPGLAIWHTGAKPDEVRVAVAWPEEDPKKQSYFRLWDPSIRGDNLSGWECDPYTMTTALLRQGDGVEVLMGGLGRSSGRLRTWHFGPDRDPRPRSLSEVAFSPSNEVGYLPVSLTLVSLSGGVPSHAAVILRPSDKTREDHLALVDLATQRIVVDVRLENSDNSQRPAAAAHGRYLAIAATRDHAVRVYAVADLLQGKTTPSEILASSGLMPRQVAFVQKGSGLWLSEDRRTRPLTGGLLFDLDKRQIRANDRANLATDTPQLGEWSFAIAADQKSVRVLQNQKEVSTVRLHGKDEEVTAAALRPPVGGQPGVLAVAYTERDAARTLILLCDPADGKPYRLLVSHLQDVQGLAFSASRPLLASVAEDQTLCVWSLADLTRAVGQVPGLEIGEDGNKVVVRRVEPGSPGAKVLAAGDVLEKVGVPGGEAKPVQDAAGFLLAVAARRPGDEIEVSVAGKGAVKLPVERGVDERKPLFSLHLLRGRPLPEWIGWSPAGPYDFSSPAAEAYLGWHTNTGDPAAPVAFAAASEYRKDYFRQGILHYLAAEADLGRALQKWDDDHPQKPPQPALRPLRPAEALPAERADEYLVRQAVRSLRFGINDDYPLDDKHVLRWRLTRSDGGKVKGDASAISGEAPRDGKEWQTDLTSVAWRRGEYQVRVALHGRADGPELATETVTLRFQPPAPALSLRREGKAVATAEQKPLEVMEDQLTLQVAVQAPAAQEMEVQLSQCRNGLPQPGATTRNQKGAGTFAQDFKLHEGLNRLVVRAVNKGALPGHEDEEAATAEVWVRYKAPHELPPRFIGLRLDPAPAVQRLDGKEVWVVSQPAVRLTGKVEAAGVLVAANWSVGETSKSFLPTRDVTVAAIDVPLENLKPGTIVPVRLRARSKHSDENTSEHWLVFHPPLPTVTIDPLDSQDLLTPKTTLTGTFQAATQDPFDLRFRVTSPEGTTKSFQPEIDRKTGKWKVELTLFPGGNTLQTIVANRWRGERTVEGAVQLRYRRPPQITAIPQEVEAVETNKVRLALTVEGPMERALTQIKVDQKAVPFVPGKPQTKGERWVWQVELPEVFANDGDRNLNQVSIQAVTDEGASQPAVVRVVHKMIPRPPLARFLRPTAADTVRRPEYAVAFKVESQHPLERIEIRRGDEALYQADVKQAQQEGSRHIFQGEARLTLKHGPNTLELVAVNKDGRSPREEVVISYTEPAVLVSIDRIEVMADNGDVLQVLKPDPRRQGEVIFPEASRSLVWLVGRVRWSDPKAKQLDVGDLKVVVKVGDCVQFPVALGPRGVGPEANVRPFRVPVTLNARNNRIRVEVPSVGQQDLSCREFALVCAAPTENQRLHVLIVGVNVKDAAELKKRVLDALAVEREARPRGPQGEFFKKPPFETCVLHHVLAGEVDRSKVEAQLVEINNEILRLQRVTGWLNDVVLIYYQGEDVVVPEKRERWLKTSRNFQFPKAPTEAFAIPCHALPRVPGAPLLLLNVAGAPEAHAAGPDWGGDPNTGFLRYACNDPSESRKADPALLNLLQVAIREKGRLGDVVQYVNDLLGRQQPAKFSPLVVLDQAQASRRINEPGR